MIAKYKITRELTSDECSWLERIYEKGEIVYLHCLDCEHDNRDYKYFAETEDQASMEELSGFSLPVNAVKLYDENAIPSKAENPNGLHKRYDITKIFERTDPRAEYFVLRLDEFGSDQNHIKACRAAILTYADHIEETIPQLAIDIRKRYVNSVL